MANSGLIAALMMVAMMCTLQPGHAQSTKNQNKFQCFTGVNIAGTSLATISSPNADACALQCTNTAGCTAFTLSAALQCTLKALPLESPNGFTGRNASVRTSCLLKNMGGALPSPADTLCFSGQDVAGVQLVSLEGLPSPAACASRCVSTPGCSYSVFRALSPSGSGRSLCQLKSNAFTGNEPAAVTRRDPGVTGICFRALGTPNVIDPLALVAGPAPFLIVTKTSPKCLRLAGPSYLNQAPVFKADCSGLDALWTYNADTKVITHYASGLCLAPATSATGATLLLSSSCGPSASNQIMARGSGGLQMAFDTRYLQPAVVPAYEGAPMVATSTISQQQYNFLPAPVPDLNFQCYPGVDVSGDSAAPPVHVAHSLACAALCVAHPGCTFYTFRASSSASAGTCSLRANPFNRNGVPSGATRDPAIAEVCFAKAKSGSLPSPANYLCYSGQQVSGSILRTSPAANPQACVDSCSATSGCTFSYFDAASQCTLGSSPFAGSQGNDMNRPNNDILNLCLRATGAPDTIASRGYVCYDGVSIAGQLLFSFPQVPSKEACARMCEARSDTCTLSVYTGSSQTCNLFADAFTGGNSGRDASKVSCLRAASGGSMNSPGNYLCYPSQSIAGTELARGAGVADSMACANICAANPQCSFTMYLPVGAGTCILKKAAFYGNESGAMNAVDPLVASTCLAAPGAPLVLSGFGKPKH